MLDFKESQQWLPEKLQAHLKTHEINGFTTTELNSIVKSPRELQQLEDPKLGVFMVVFEPPSLDDRIVNQYAALTAMSRPDIWPGDWLRSRDKKVCQKIVIARQLKAKIRERLDMMNITERILDPGLDGLARWLTRYYGPAWPDPAVLQPIYTGQHLEFYRTPNGWEYVQRPGARGGIAIVAVTREHRLLLVEQYREPLGQPVIELPAGLIEAGETADDTVRKEPLQETGYRCMSVASLTETVLSPGLANEANILYRADGLTRQEASNNDMEHGRVICHGPVHGLMNEHERIRTWEVPIDEVPAWLQQRREGGVVVDLRIYAALHFAQKPE